MCSQVVQSGSYVNESHRGRGFIRCSLGTVSGGESSPVSSERDWLCLSLGNLGTTERFHKVTKVSGTCGSLCVGSPVS